MSSKPPPPPTSSNDTKIFRHKSTLLSQKLKLNKREKVLSKENE